MSHCVYLGRYLRLDRSFPNGCAVPQRKDVCESPLYTVEKLQRHMPLLGTNCVHTCVQGCENLHALNLLKGRSGNIIQVHQTPKTPWFRARTKWQHVHKCPVCRLRDWNTLHQQNTTLHSGRRCDGGVCRFLNRNTTAATDPVSGREGERGGRGQGGEGREGKPEISKWLSPALFLPQPSTSFPKRKPWGGGQPWKLTSL